MRAPPTSISIGHIPTRGRRHSPHRRIRQNAFRFPRAICGALTTDPNRHEPCRSRICRRRELLTPDRKQPAGNAVPSCHLRNVGALLEALRYDPRLLLGRPPAPLTLPRNNLDPSIRIIFLPGIKHGICHRLISNEQLMPGSIAGQSRDGEVARSCQVQDLLHLGDWA